MNVAEIPADQAFSGGADLWILKNDSQNNWWQEIDFRSGFLLTQCLHYHKKPMATKVNEILELTEFPRSEIIADTNCLLIGSSDHFLNKWILIWDPPTPQVNETLERISKTLKFNSVRFFSESDIIIKNLKASRKASLTDITFIKNT